MRPAFLHGALLCAATLVLQVFVGALCAQAPGHTPALNSGEPVVIGEKLEIRSDILKQLRPLIIAKPAGYEQSTEPYPVLYLLDGDQHFHHTTGITGFLAESGRIPGLLVVAIPNTNRNRDLTPPSQAENDLRFFPDNGGADAFLRFIGDELIPYVDKNYRTRPYRILAGHSFGGLFAIHALISRPDLFRAYIAMDPSLQWNSQAILSKAQAFLATTPELNVDLYLAAADEAVANLSGIHRLCAALEEKAPSGFRWRFKLMAGQTHPSVPHLGTYLALDTIFDGWHLANPLELYDKGGIEAVHRHFREGRKRLGYDRTTPPFTVSLMVAALLRSGRLDEAASLLLHDPKAYPPPWNQLDALAAAYASRGQAERAVRYYALSLEQNPANENARKKLKQLGAGGPRQ